MKIANIEEFFKKVESKELKDPYVYLDSGEIIMSWMEYNEDEKEDLPTEDILWVDEHVFLEFACRKLGVRFGDI